MRLFRLLPVFGLALVVALHTEAKDYTTLRIGMDASFPPFESVDQQGQIVGFEVDYANAICAKIHVTCTFQNQDWDGVIPALLSSKFDVIFSSMNITDARKEKVIFSQVYYAPQPVFAGRAEEKSNDVSPAALKGKTIGTQSSTIHVNYLEKYYPDADVKLYPTLDEANLDLASGRLDYVVGDSIVEGNFIDKRGNGCCRTVSNIQRVLAIHGPGIGAAFRPGDTELRDKFNQAIDDLDADGTYKRIEARYFKVDIRGK